MRSETRAEAKRLGHVRYFTGEACPHGHIDERYTRNGGCVTCRRVAETRWSKAHPAKRRENNARYRARNAAIIRVRDRAKHRRRMLADPEAVRASARRRRGLPEPTRPRPPVCECCGGQSTRTLHLDHSHTTGAFRGWLCTNCNTAIGKLGDNPQGVCRALAYLLRSPI